MNEDLIQMGNIFGDSTGSGSGYGTVPTAQDFTDAAPSAVDSSGNLTLPMGIEAGGSILSAYGDILSGNEEAQADQYNASLALMQGQFNVDQLAEGETQTLSRQKAMYAKAGVEMSGSPLDTAVSTASNFEMDKQIATYNAKSRANADNYAAQVAKQQGELGAAGSLLQGAEGIGLMAALM